MVQMVDVGGSRARDDLFANLRGMRDAVRRRKKNAKGASAEGGIERPCSEAVGQSERRQVGRKCCDNK